jgi:2-hydroxy-3-keto-5-methylthiopentenyl-1-phosphate phosphatase
VKPVIFCDFDGTITETDNIISLMKQFAPPEWVDIKDLTIQEGVRDMFALLSSGLQDDIINYLKETAIIRDGFAEFVQYTKDEKIPLYIVSGGIDFFVYPLLQGLVERESIYCNGSDFSEDVIQVLWPNSCDESCTNGCGCCKPTIIKRHTHKNNQIIVIGDSITDLQAAKKADIVFARDFLKTKLTELNKPFYSFETFYDVIEKLQQKKVVKA